MGVEFTVLAAGDSKLEIRRPTGDDRDVLLTQSQANHIAGEVDYEQPVFLVQDSASSQQQSSFSVFGPSAPNAATSNDESYVYWGFTDLPDDRGDSTPLEANEPNAVFRSSWKFDDTGDPDDVTEDVGLLRLLSADAPSSPSPNGDPRVPPIYLTISHEGISSSDFTLYFNTDEFFDISVDEVSGSASWTTQYLIEPSETYSDPNGHSIYITIEANSNQNEAFDLGELDFLIEYPVSGGTGPGQVSSSPPNPVGQQHGTSTATVKLSDIDETLTLQNVRHSAEPSAPDASATTEIAGYFSVELQPPSGTVPAGLSGRSDLQAETGVSYFETDIRLLLELAEDNDSATDSSALASSQDFTVFGVLTGDSYGDGVPLSQQQFKASLATVGDRYADQLSKVYFAEDSGEGLFDAIKPIQLGLNQLHAVPGEAGVFYYAVNDSRLNDDWIEVHGDESSAAKSLYRRLDVWVLPNQDAIDEGTESFNAHLQTRLIPDSDVDVSHPAKHSVHTYYASSVMAIEDAGDADPTYDSVNSSRIGELESDGVCSCPCTACASGLPVNLQDGSTSYQPSRYGNAFAPFLPTYHSKGAHSTEQTIRMGFPFVSLDAAPAVKNIAGNLQIGGDLPQDAAFSRDFQIELPKQYGGDPNDSLAVRAPVQLPSATATGAYLARMTADATGEQDNDLGGWEAKTPVLVNNIEHNNDFAPGWVFPFDYKLFVGVPEGGTQEDRGAALFRPNQSASWFRATQTGFASPVDSFDSLSGFGSAYQITMPDGARLNFEPSDEANHFRLKTMVDAHGNTTGYTYDAQSRITEVLDPLGRATHYNWDIEGRLDVTDYRGRLVRMVYENAGSGAAVTISYPDELGVISANSEADQVLYDSRGYVTSIVDGENRTTHIEYKSIIHETNSSPGDTSFFRVSQIQEPDGSHLDILSHGIDDALPDRQWNWLNRQTWNSRLIEQQLTMSQIMSSYYTQRWNSFDVDLNETVEPAFYHAPKASLKEIENYVVYQYRQANVSATAPPNNLTTSIRRFEATLDRRGRTNISRDPLGNVESFDREPFIEYVTKEFKRADGSTATQLTDEVKSDQGLVKTYTGADPDRHYDWFEIRYLDGELERPVTTYEYHTGTPFASSIQLEGRGAESGTHRLVQEFGSYQAGMPSSVTDELGHTIYYGQDFLTGRIRSVSTEWQAPIHSRWTNPLDPFDVNGDENTSALDALQIINELNTRDLLGLGSAITTSRTQDSSFFDVSQDGNISALDALQVINRLNEYDSGTATPPEPTEEPTLQTETVYLGDDRYNSWNVPSFNFSSLTEGAKQLVGAVVSVQSDRNAQDKATVYDYYLDATHPETYGKVRAIYEVPLNRAGAAPETIDWANGLKTSWTYDAFGFPSSSTDPRGLVTFYEYNALGQLTRLTTPDPDDFSHSTHAGFSNRTNGPLTPTVYDFRYDSRGNLFEEKVNFSTWATPGTPHSLTGLQNLAPERQSKVTNYFYDSSDRLVVLVSPLPDNDPSAVELSPYIPAQQGSGATSPYVLNGVPPERPTTSFFYDSLGNLIRITGAEGEATSFEHDVLGRVTSESVHAIEAVSYAGNDLTLETTFGRASTMQYYTSGLLKTENSAAGIASKFQYDSLGRPIAMERRGIDSSGAPLSEEFHRRTWGYSQIDVGNHYNWLTTTADFSIDPDEVGSPEYEPEMLLSTILETDPMGRVVSESQHLDGFGQAASYATTHYLYSVSGDLAQLIDAEGVSTFYEYDGLGRQSSTVSPAGISQSLRDKLGINATRYPREDAVDRQTFSYDTFGQLVSTVDPTGIETEHHYDNFGNMVQMVTGNLGSDYSLSQFEYDGLSRLHRQVNGDSEATARQASPATGETPFSTTSNDNTTDDYFFYDRLGRMTDRYDALAHTQYEYDRSDRLTKLIDPNLNATQYSYDQRGLVETEWSNFFQNQQGQNVTTYKHYSYDAAGRMLQVQDHSDRIIRYVYDGLGNLSEEIWFSERSNHNIQASAELDLSATPARSEVERLTYDHDVLGRVLAHQSPGAAAVTYEYDAAGRLWKESQSVDGQEFLLTNTYLDNALRQMATATVQGADVYEDELEYNIRNRMTSITREFAGGEITAALSHDAAGRLTEISRGVSDGSTAASFFWTSTYDYDDAGRIQEIRHDTPTTSGNATAHASYSVYWNAAGQITDAVSSWQERPFKFQANTVAAYSRYKYDYDHESQLVGWSLLDSANATDGSGNASYDAAGNDLSDQAVVGSGNRVQEDSDWIYYYDASGNLIEKSSNVSGDATRMVYHWDHRNRLKQVDAYSPFNSNVLDHTIRYEYDATNRLVSRTIDDPSDLDDREEIYFYDGDQITVQTVDGTVSEHFLWSEGIDQLLAEVDASDGKTTWMLTDHQGSVRDRVWADGEVRSNTSYDPFGEVVESTGWNPEELDTFFGYTGRLFDEATDLQYNTNRWYDPQQRRWLSKDPIGFAADDANLYRYVRNQPTTLTDPSGLEPPQLSPEQVNDLINNQTPLIQPNSPYGGIRLSAHGNGLPAGSYGPEKKSTRPLTPGEIEMLNKFFEGQLNTDGLCVGIGKLHPFAGRNSITPRYTPWFPMSNYAEDFSEADIDLQGHFIHEMTHVLQSQNGNFNVADFFYHLAKNKLQYGLTYYYDQDDLGQPLYMFNFEQQAKITEHYYEGAGFHGRFDEATMERCRQTLKGFHTQLPAFIPERRYIDGRHDIFDNSGWGYPIFVPKDSPRDSIPYGGF